MKILKQEKTGNKVKLEIEEDQAIFKAMVEKAYEEAAEEVSVPGFRKGKVPRNIIEQHLNSEAVVERATQNLVSALYHEIIKQANIEPVNFPNVVILSQEASKPFLFSVEVEVYPEVKLGKYKGLKVEKGPESATDAEVDSFIRDLRERLAQVTLVSGRGIESEDMVEIDVKASAEGGDVKGLSGKKINIVVGKADVSAEFDKELLGLNVGQSKDFKVKVSEDHPAKEIAGKLISFSVTPKKISKRNIPEANDDFARNVSGAPSFDVFKTDVKDRMEEDKKARVEGEVKNKLIEEAAKVMTVDIPSGMIHRETDLMIDELTSTIARDRLTLEEYLKLTKKTEESLRGELKTGAEGRVRAKLCLRAIAEKEKLVVGEADLSKEIEVLAKSSGETPEKFRANIADSGLEYIKDYLLRRNALEYIMSEAKIVSAK